MEYNEIPTAIKELTNESVQITYVIKHDLQRYTEPKPGKIKVGCDGRVVHVNSEKLEELLLEQLESNSVEIARLEEIHSTLQKVSVGLINK